MGENSKIEWTDNTFNPWTGCTKVSPACDNCYAESWAKRSGIVQWGNNPRRRTSPANWRKPIKWNAEAERLGVRYKVFCASLADVFDNHGSITSGWHGDLWHLIDSTPNLDWLLLTKRPQNIVKMLPESYGMPEWGDGWPNVWLGTTAENQEEADRRIPILLDTPAAVRFVSIEPMLGPVEIPPDLDWVICGGESGPGARPMHPDWARTLRDQCQATGTAFLFKQWGEWLPGENHMIERPVEPAQWQDGETGWHSSCRDKPEDRTPEWRHFGNPGDPGAFALRVGKKRAGRMLDGRTWDEMPKAKDTAHG